MKKKETTRRFTDGVHRTIPPERVPPWFKELRSKGTRIGIRVELVLLKSGRIKRFRVQFRTQGGKRKWWRLGYWHPHNRRLFLEGRPGYLEISDWQRTLEAVARSCGLLLGLSGG